MRIIATPIKNLCYLQCGITFGMAVVLSFTSDWRYSSSALLGGMVCCLPTWVFACLYFKNQGARAAKQIVQAFYRGEALKIGLTLLLFALIFQFQAIAAVPFFMTYIAAQVMYWFILYYVK